MKNYIKAKIDLFLCERKARKMFIEMRNESEVII